MLSRWPDDPPAVVRAEVYNDSTGELLYKGRLTLEPASEPIPSFRDAHLYAGWDGRSLHLADGRQFRITGSDK